MYISRLKALINDQWRRLEELAETIAIPVTPWHGDISQARKATFHGAPAGLPAHHAGIAGGAAVPAWSRPGGTTLPACVHRDR